MNKVRVLVDAEYTYVNPALSLVTMAMMKKFNKDGAWIWNTYQCYLKANISNSLFFFYKCQTFLLNALNNVGGGITKQTTVSPSAVCVCQESRSLLLEALRLSQNEDFCLGVKLVRGAYMDKERRLAEEEGRLDPIHKSWEDTNDRWIGGSGH